MSWFTASQVTVVDGSDIVRVVSAEPISTILPEDGLLIRGTEQVEILLAYTEDGTGDQIIQLKLDWDQGDQTEQPARVIPNASNFRNAATTLKDVTQSVFTQLDVFFTWGLQTTGTVTYSGKEPGDPDITVNTLPQWNTTLTALAQSATDSVNDLAAVDTAVNGPGGLVEVVDGINSTLTGYVTSSSDSADLAQEYAVKTVDQYVTNTTDYSSLHHATKADSSRSLAEGAESTTSGLKDDVVLLKSQTTDIYDDAYDLATVDKDVPISPGVFSLKHYAEKTIEAAAQAQAAVASVTSGISFVGPWAGGGTTAPPPPADDQSGNPMYKITVQTTVDGIVYDINDSIVWDSANSVWNGSAWTTEAWFKIDNTENVASVNGKTGVVTIAIADIAGLQTILDTIADKVAQSTYDSEQSVINGRLAAIELDASIQMWSIRR